MSTRAAVTVTELLNLGHTPLAIDDACAFRKDPSRWVDAGLEVQLLRADAWRSLRTLFRDPLIWRDAFGVRRLVDLVQNGQNLDEWGYTFEDLGAFGYLEPAKVYEGADWALRPPAGVTDTSIAQMTEITIRARPTPHSS